MANEADYVELGLACADVCKALERGVNEGRLDELSRSVCEAIEQLTRQVKPGMHIVRDSLTMLALDCRTVAEIQEKVIEKAGRNVLSRLLHASNDKDVMTSWKSDINRALHVFNVSPSRFCFAIVDLPLSDRTGGQYPYGGFGYPS